MESTRMSAAAIGQSPYSVVRPCRLHEVPRWDLEADVLVLGFGAAGACAAIEAARAGAGVCLFEASSGSGGTSALSGGEIYFGGSGGTPIQNAAGFTDTTEDMAQYLIMAGGPNVDEARARRYAENSLAHFHWLLEQGVRYKYSFIPERIVEPMTDDCLIWSGSEEAWPFSQQAKPCPRGHTPEFMGMGAGRYLMDVLTERVEQAGVEVRYNTRVISLIADDTNRVHGLVYKHEGRIGYARAQRGVILCAGGFVMNRELLAQSAPQLLRCSQPIGTVDDGSGIQLGQSVGGVAINMAEGFVTVPWYPPESLIKGIFINERGQRFINEDCYHGRVSAHILRQQCDRIFLLLDQAIYSEPLFGEHFRIGIGAAGDTWAEVERELELAPGALTATVELYNHHAAQGQDPQFHKAAKWLRPLVDPPFVALDLRVDYAAYTCFTLGGLHTRPSGEVLNAQGLPIHGLYAAGRTACGLPRWGEGYSSGLSLADATYFGREAGRAAAG